MYAHQPAQVEAYLEAADSALELVALAMARDDVAERLQGSPSAVGFKRLT